MVSQARSRCCGHADNSSGYYYFFFRASHARTNHTDWTTLYGGSLRYWMRISASNNSAMLPALIIQGENATLQLTCPGGQGPDLSWYEFDIPLDTVPVTCRAGPGVLLGSTYWVTEDGVTHADAAHFSKVLGAVTDLHIRGEYHVGGSDVAYLDAVRIQR
jgi:Laminin B (Domain IV)